MNCLKCKKEIAKVEKQEDQFCNECNHAMLLELHLEGCKLAFMWYQEAELTKKVSTPAFKRILDSAIEKYNKLKKVA